MSLITFFDAKTKTNLSAQQRQTILDACTVVNHDALSQTIRNLQTNHDLNQSEWTVLFAQYHHMREMLAVQKTVMDDLHLLPDNRLVPAMDWLLARLYESDGHTAEYQYAQKVLDKFLDW